MKRFGRRNLERDFEESRVLTMHAFIPSRFRVDNDVEGLRFDVNKAEGGTNEFSATDGSIGLFIGDYSETDQGGGSGTNCIRLEKINNKVTGHDLLVLRASRRALLFLSDTADSGFSPLDPLSGHYDFTDGWIWQQRADGRLEFQQGGVGIGFRPSGISGNEALIYGGADDWMYFRGLDLGSRWRNNANSKNIAEIGDDGHAKFLGDLNTGGIITRVHDDQKNIGDNAVTTIFELSATTIAGCQGYIFLTVALKSSVDMGYTSRVANFLITYRDYYYHSDSTHNWEAQVAKIAEVDGGSWTSGYADIDTIGVAFSSTTNTLFVALQSDHSGSSGGTVEASYKAEIMSVSGLDKIAVTIV